HGNARVAVVAIGAVREGAAAPKPGGDEGAVGLRVDEVARRRHLRARELARQVAARVRRGRVELQVRDRKVVELRQVLYFQISPMSGYCIESSSNCEKALRGISRAPSEARWAVACWQSITRTPWPRRRSTRATSAAFDASGARVNMDSPKKTRPSAMP